MTHPIPDVLNLYPGGYPVHVDVPQHLVDGAGTALRFELPLRGLNFPLSHAHETKLVTALGGELVLRTGAGSHTRLEVGQAVLVPSGTAHRIAQHGAHPATVGIALWPGAVEEAFRALDRAVARHGFRHGEAAALFARYGVQWDAAQAQGTHAPALEVVPVAQALQGLPPALRQALARCWLLNN